MKTLRCSVVVATISFLAVIGIAQTSEADPITYFFFGFLGDCTSPNCLNDWSGHDVIGQFTFDSSVPTLLTGLALSISQPVSFDWRILFPDPVPNQLIFSATPTSLNAHEILYPNDPVLTDDFLIRLVFNGPLTASAGSTLQSGFIARGIVPIQAPFVYGAAGPLVPLSPEPSSILLMGTGLAAAVGVAWRKRKHRAPIR
jgi:hypothetical protein